MIWIDRSPSFTARRVKADEDPTSVRCVFSRACLAEDETAKAYGRLFKVSV